jgi:hypothetical protein
MGFDGRNQQVGIAGPLIIDVVVDHNLVFGFLQFHHFAEFVGLARLALANDFSRRLEQAEYLAFFVLTSPR